jgi:hypothetical protein
VVTPFVLDRFALGLVTGNSFKNVNKISYLCTKRRPPAHLILYLSSLDLDVELIASLFRLSKQMSCKECTFTDQAGFAFGTPEPDIDV